MSTPNTSPQRLRHWLKTVRQDWWVVGLFSMVTNLMMLAPTLYMIQVFDRVLVSHSELTLLALSLVTVFLLAMMTFAEWSRSRLLVRLGVRLNNLLSQRVFKASFEAHLTRPGLQPAKPLADLNEVRQFLTGQSVTAFFDAPWTPIFIAVLFFLHPVLGWTAIGFGALQTMVAYLTHRQALQPVQALGRQQSLSVGHVQTKLRNADAIAAMGMLESLRQRWQANQNAYLAQHATTHGAQHRAKVISKWLRYAQQSLALGTGAWLVIRGELSPGAMIAANVLATRALAPIDLLVGNWQAFLSARQAHQRLSALLDEFDGEATALQKVLPTGSVRLENVTACAPGSETPILKEVSLTISPGTVTVVMGASGSGKSTLARVLLGVWPPQSGTVWWGERPLEAWSPEERGATVGYLPQDVELFEGSLADNIARLSSVDAPRVIAAAQLTGLHDMILRFPKGYDTPIGVGGVLLSGGQRQRLGLARAVYGDPALVVLDEPNANLDDAGEAALMQAVTQLRARGAAVLLISHRTSTLRIADQLVVMHSGRIQHAGPRDAVLRQLSPKAPPIEPTALSTH
jgi:ATP-binding cassette subfamily C exporter for protease/lipase